MKSGLRHAKHLLYHWVTSWASVYFPLFFSFKAPSFACNENHANFFTKSILKNRRKQNSKTFLIHILLFVVSSLFNTFIAVLQNSHSFMEDKKDHRKAGNMVGRQRQHLPCMWGVQGSSPRATKMKKGEEGWVPKKLPSSSFTKNWNGKKKNRV